jgi:hypothetical protein
MVDGRPLLEGVVAVAAVEDFHWQLTLTLTVFPPPSRC